ncbi:unnamed protein product [Colletotrichum noveboracense]|uniref:Zinc finger PHD-type domain-containing protein n=1 Tax=Colletotrichum noveboracense TaxID=2664923 RepID=A0A9W4RT41_9PEZI|nr:hypothetical protein K456DRAFT_1745944 [Colletotrichum gloeosporioides 23]KAJ0294647.1 hypothetical protein CBS470a_000556 [Colletotrichum nupharicola]CAI0646811.1 unnamed protein product [Colletotrichum noveboracense]
MTAHSRRQRSTPFLQRNILQGMGNSQSSAQKAAAARDPPIDNDDNRATKRRRTEAKIQPHTLQDQLFHAREVGDVQRNLCVRIGKISHKESKRVSLPPDAYEDVIKLRSRCKVSLWHYETILYCNSQVCDITSFKDPGGPLRMARVSLPRPFYIPKDTMRVNNERNNSFDLADEYRLCIELEAAAPTVWPPIILNGEEPGRSHKSEAHRWVFVAAMSNLFSSKPASLILKVRTGDSELVATDYVIEVDTLWTSAFEASAIRPLEDGVKPSITVHPELTGDAFPADFQQFESPPVSPVKEVRNGLTTPVKGLRNGVVNGDAHDDDEAEEELTPNRSLRVRGATKNYNLKVLSDKAQGREKKQRRRRNTNAVEDGTVLYKMPSEQVQLDSFRCVTCGAAHDQLQQLQAHLVNQHAEYDFKPKRSARGLEWFEVEHRYRSYMFGAEPFTLRRPTKVFSLDQFADGNISQVTSRLDADDETASSAQPRGRSRGRSRHSATRAPPPEARSKLIIPDIKQTLYDPITRATLDPGSEYRKPEPSDQWLIQWHRDALADFSDVPPDEREYMQEWDKFMLTKRISSNIYFPRAWLSFVKLKADWLLSSQNRMVEFGKHFTYLLARSSLDHATVEEALEHISVCRDKLGVQNGNSTTPKPKESPKGPHIRKSAAGCQVCGLAVLGPRLLLCSNEECGKRLYHSDCISENAKKDVEAPDWLCNECVGKQEQQSR